jgi:hypothetical protein
MTQSAPTFRDARIQSLWNDVWQTFQSGGVYEPIIAIVEAELAGFGAALPPSDAAAVIDFQKAQNTHLFQSRHFANELAKITVLQEEVRWALQQTMAEMDKYNQHTLRSLTLAHGGIVIATLAYIQSLHQPPLAFVAVVGLGAFGYLLTIIGAAISVRLMAPLLKLLGELLAPRLAVAERQSRIEGFQKGSKKVAKWTRPFFYASAGCLIFALFIGIKALVDERNSIGPPSPTAHSAALPLMRQS